MKKIAIILFAAVAILIGGAVYSHVSTSTALAQGTILKANVSKGVSVTTSSTKLLDASSGRTYAVFVNDGAVPVYLSIDGNTAVRDAGIRLNASGGSYEINSLNQFVAQVNAITASGSAQVTVTAAQ